MTSRPNTTRLGLETLEARDTPASPGVGTVLQSGDFIAFETRLGRYFSSQASIGAVSAVPLANLDPQASDAVFTIHEVGGDGIIQSGDRIAIRTRQGYYLNSHASVGAVSAVPHANLDPQVSDEVFTIIKRSGASPDPAITSTDQVMLATRTGFYFNSWGSQGGVQAVRQANFDTGVSDEIFTLLEIPRQSSVPRALPDSTKAGDPGTTRESAYVIGAVSNKALTFTGRTDQKSDVDLFRIDVKAGQTVKIRIDDTWNHKHGDEASGLRVNVNLYNSHGQFMTGGPHQNSSSGFDLEFKASRDERFYIGVSAAGNSNYNIVTGGRTVAPKYMALGGYTLSVGEPSAFTRFPPGVYVAGRDLNSPGGGVGTHQYLILVPQNPNQFSGLKDLGDGSKGLVIGAHNIGGRLTMRQNEPADFQATQEYANPSRDFDPTSRYDFDTEVAQVNLAGTGIDSTIRALIQASNYYHEYTRLHQIEYPNLAKQVAGSGVNSNSWAQSIVQHVVGAGRVQEDFIGRDLLHSKRIGREYFIR